VLESWGGVGNVRQREAGVETAEGEIYFRACEWKGSVPFFWRRGSPGREIPGFPATIRSGQMHEYDAALKNILMRPGSSVLAQITGASSLKWLNVEAPKVSNRRVDLLGELPDRNLVHIELQSRNEKDFPLRMAEYLFGIGRQYGKLPRQVALYVGELPLRMTDRVEGPDVSVRFHLVDIRDLDGERLLTSANIGDNVLAVLTRLGERPQAVRRILTRIAAGRASRPEWSARRVVYYRGIARSGDILQYPLKSLKI